jgi:ABC-type sugar transport system permease subunit
MIVLETREANSGAYYLYMLLGIIGISVIVAYFSIKIIFYFKNLMKLKKGSPDFKESDKTKTDSLKKMLYLKIIVNSIVLAVFVFLLIMMILSYVSI